MTTAPSPQAEVDRHEGGANWSRSARARLRSWGLLPAVAPEVIHVIGTPQDPGLAAFLTRYRAVLLEKCASPELVDGLVDAVANGMAAGLTVAARQAAERHASDPVKLGRAVRTVQAALESRAISLSDLMPAVEVRSCGGGERR